jgi:predicted ATPase
MRSERASIDVGGSEPFVKAVELRRDDVPGWRAYPFNLPAVRDLSYLPLHPKVTFLVGENGSGKSTLLEAIAVAWGFNAEGGSRNFNFSTKVTHSALSNYIRLIRGTVRPHDGFFLRAESFYNVATEVENLGVSGYGDRPLHEQSHGEAFFSLFMHRFRGDGLYLLDEPEAALSPTRQMSMLTRLHALVRGGSQFVIATHSPILMAYPDARILSFSAEDGMREVSYEETEHYFITREFLNNRERMLSVLLEERDGGSGT